MINPKLFIAQINTLQTLSGLDFGDKTIGIAISDKTHTIATPIKTLSRKSIKIDIIELKNLFKEYNVGGVILGLPLSLNGEENESTRKVREFSSILQKSSDYKITFYDERFSSDIVFNEFRKGKLSATKIKKKLNHLAASYILQGFLDNAKN